MAKIKFHQIAAFIVLAASAAWVVTGEFSSVGSEAAEAEKEAPKAEAPAKLLRTVAVVKAPQAEHARVIRVSGLTEADKRATLAARAGGIITELPVAQGQHVESGALILSLDAAARRAGVETAKQVLAQREAETKAIERLAKNGSVAKLQVDNARSGLAAAKSQLETAQSDLDAVQVVAPFAGVIDRLDVEKGSSVAQGAQVAVLLSLDPVIAAGEISERNLGYVKVGDPAAIKLVSGWSAEGKIRYISREANPATRTFRVEVAVANSELKIPAGMTAEISISADKVLATYLPRSVITLGPKGDLGVRLADDANVVQFLPIDLIDDTEKGLVLAGIPAGARIIVAGQDLVSDGDTVNAVEADPEMIKKLAAELGVTTE